MSALGAEHTETLKAEVLVALRRLGANRVHFALVMPETLVAAEHWGAACTLAQPPIVAFCERTLRGSIVAIPEGNLDGWRKQGHICRECQLVARFAIARAEAGS